MDISCQATRMISSTFELLRLQQTKMEEQNVLNVLKHLDDGYIGEVNVTEHLKAKYFQIQFLRKRFSESGEV